MIIIIITIIIIIIIIITIIIIIIMMIICGNLSLVIALWVDIIITYIAWNPIFTFLCQFYAGDLAKFAISTIIFFFIAVLIMR